MFPAFRAQRLAFFYQHVPDPQRRHHRHKGHRRSDAIRDLLNTHVAKAGLLQRCCEGAQVGEGLKRPEAIDALKDTSQERPHGPGALQKAVRDHKAASGTQHAKHLAEYLLRVAAQIKRSGADGEVEGRAREAARAAIDNPLLDDVSMVGAKGVLINITGGYDMTLFELDEAANEIRREVDNNANIILGSTFDPELEGRIRVSVVAAGVAEQAAAVAIAPSIETPAMPDIPVVVSQPAPAATPTEPMPAPMEDIETDHRPDFRGRALPAAHVESQQGSDQVSADAAFTKPVSDSPAGFSNLFGWRREDAVGDNDSEEDKPAIVSTPDDHPKPAAFDDEDLEIPAFLRRSANT